MLQQGGNNRLGLSNFPLISSLLLLETLHEFIYLALLLIQDFILLRLISLGSGSATATSFLLSKVLLDLLDVSLIGLNHLPNVGNVLLQLLDLRVVLLDSVQQSLTCLWEWEVHLIGLQLQVVLPLVEVRSLLFQVLRALLEGVLLQAGLRRDEASVDLLKVGTAAVDFTLEGPILFLEFFIFIPLLGIEIVQL